MKDIASNGNLDIILRTACLDGRASKSPRDLLMQIKYLKFAIPSSIYKELMGECRDYGIIYM